MFLVCSWSLLYICITSMSICMFWYSYLTTCVHIHIHILHILFIAGEILVSVIEQQAVIDSDKIYDAQTLSYLIGNGTFSTILSESDITFSELHQAEGDSVMLQYTTVSTFGAGLYQNS